MSFTVQNIVDDTRIKVSDTSEPYRWDDDQIITVVNDAIQHIFSVRPDAVTSATLDGPDEVTVVTDTVPFRRLFRGATTFYTSGMLLQDRSSDKSLRTQGEGFIKIFNALVGV